MPLTFMQFYSLLMTIGRVFQDRYSKKRIQHTSLKDPLQVNCSCVFSWPDAIPSFIPSCDFLISFPVIGGPDTHSYKGVPFVYSWRDLVCIFVTSCPQSSFSSIKFDAIRGLYSPQFFLWIFSLSHFCFSCFSSSFCICAYSNMISFDFLSMMFELRSVIQGLFRFYFFAWVC